MRAPPFAAVWFDCDSTLTSIEGVDELLQWAEPALRADIAALTRQAMEGTLALAEVYETRLRQLAPRREQLEQVGRLYVQRAVPDAREVIAALRHLGKQVGICSGGLAVPVLALAAHLGIDAGNVQAVPVLFHADGGYQDFDRRSPLWRNGGKVEVLRALPATQRPLVFVGDGVTDLEAQGTVDLFVGYGGVAVRSKVKQAAECWLESKSLAPLLRLVLTATERATLASAPAFAALLARMDAAVT
ncbi:MAG TPA: HAD-IB family phosphatase [Planctomycetota bacterium]|nr:HAD-IB family phosphatase [Planctomycetota bacterium]